MAAEIRRRAAVIGGGLMGHGIAQVLAAGGVHVAVYDPSTEALHAVTARIAENLSDLGQPVEALQRISLHDTLRAAVVDADWVFEAAPERVELKQQIFAELDEAAPPGAVLATNTSVISVTEIAALSRGRDRIVGTHWWNPPYLVPLVEVVQTPQTSEDVVRRTMVFLTELGKTPVHVHRDVPGFVGNRLQHALWREAINLVDEGVCDAETVDTVVKAGFGLRLPVLGPLENADLVGLGLTLDIHGYILPRLHPPSEPSPGLRARVADGELGMSTGRGFRDWTPEVAAAVHRRLRNHLKEAVK